MLKLGPGLAHLSPGDIIHVPVRNLPFVAQVALMGLEGIPHRCRPIACYEASAELAAQYRRDR